MRKSIDALEAEAKKAIEKSRTGRLRLGFDYVITAEMPVDSNSDADKGLSKLSIDR